MRTTRHSDANAREPVSIDRFPARVIIDVRDVPAVAVVGVGGAAGSDVSLTQRDKVLTIIRDLCPDPTVIADDGSNVYLWAAEISSDREDYYSTRMDPETTLVNFVEDLINGIAFLNSHNQYELPSGRSFGGKLVNNADGSTSVYGAFYTIADLNLTGLSTDDLMRGIRAGIVSDVSVGFKRGAEFMNQCSICGRDLYTDYDCEHFPGMTYQVWDAGSEQMIDVRCTILIKDAHLREASGVYDGATPKAMIDKAVMFSERGLLKDADIFTLERSLRISLPHKAGSKSGSDEPDNTRTGEDTDMANGDQPTKPQVNKSLVDMSRSVGAFEDTYEPQSTEEIVRALKTRFTELKSAETQRDAYREAEIADALKEGVRAMGGDFNEEQQKKILAKLDLDEVRSTRQAWQKLGDEKLAGGRRSVDGEDTTDADAAADAESTDADAAAAGADATAGGAAAAAGAAADNTSSELTDEQYERMMRSRSLDSSFR